MTVAAPLLTRRAVLQVAMESTYRTEASVGANDALYVEEPDYAVDVNLLERNFARDDISPLANIVGRRTASLKFTTELKGNGAQNSGVAADAPLIARLFRASGYSLTAFDDVDTTDGVPDRPAHPQTSPGRLTLTGAATTDLIGYFLEVTTGGASGTAHDHRHLGHARRRLCCRRRDHGHGVQRRHQGPRPDPRLHRQPRRSARSGWSGCSRRVSASIRSPTISRA